METNALNIDPNFWGPHVWATIHTLALKADSQNEITAFNNFADSLHFLLPCDNCKGDFHKWHSKNGYAHLGQAFSWSVKLHNYVNEKLGKQTVDIEEARSQWLSDSCSFSCLTPKKSNISVPIVPIIIVLLIVLYVGTSRIRISGKL